MRPVDNSEVAADLIESLSRMQALLCYFGLGNSSRLGQAFIFDAVEDAADGEEDHKCNLEKIEKEADGQAAAMVFASCRHVFVA